MKKNPLFIDSTKFQGDTIVTVVEISNVPMQSGDSLFVKTKQEGEEEQVTHLVPHDDGYWRSQLHLLHQQPLRYHFFLIRDNRIVETTAQKSCMASYLLQERWPDSEDNFNTSVPQLKSLSPFDEALARFHERIGRCR